MTNEEMLRRLANGELPCEIVAVSEGNGAKTLRAGSTLVVIPQDTLRVTADQRREGADGFVQVIGNTIVATWKEEEIFWVRPSHQHRSVKG